MSEAQCGQYLNIEDRERQCTLPADHSKYNLPHSASILCRPSSSNVPIEFTVTISWGSNGLPIAPVTTNQTGPPVTGTMQAEAPWWKFWRP